MNKEEIPFNGVEIKNQTDIIKVLDKSNEYVKDAVANYKKTFTTIDMNDAMDSLNHAGKLLKLANASSIGFDCNKEIIGILSDFQCLLSDSSIATNQMVVGSMGALNLINIALTIIDRSPGNALKFICKTSDRASKMVDVCQKLVESSSSLLERSNKALNMANGAHIDSINSQKKIQKEIDLLETKVKRLDNEVKSYKNQIVIVNKHAKKAAKDAETERKRAYTLNLIGAFGQVLVAPIHAIFSPISNNNYIGKTENPGSNSINVGKEIKNQKEILENKEKDILNQIEIKNQELSKLNAQSQTDNVKLDIKKTEESIKELHSNLSKNENEITNLSQTFVSDKHIEMAKQCQDKELELLKMKFQLQELEINLNGESVENLAKIEKLNKNHDFLATSILSLELTINTLGKVKTIFKNTLDYWRGIKITCESLSDNSHIEILSNLAKESEEDRILFINQVKGIGIMWFSLVSLNYDALNLIQKAKSNFDKVMCDLPGRDKAKTIVNKLAPKLTSKIINKITEINDNLSKTSEQIESLESKK